MQPSFFPKSTFCVFALCLLFANPSLYAAPKTVLLKKTADKTDQKIEYPQGFSDKKVDEAVQALIKDIQARPCPPDQTIEPTKQATPGLKKPVTPGKASASKQQRDLYVDYAIKYQKKAAVSLLFNISTYVKGAAHPCNSVRTLNFLQGKPISLSELFLPKVDFLAKLATICKSTLSKKDISTPEWLASGTKPTSENYSRWYWVDEGLVIVFDTYQVAAYVYGPQAVFIPKQAINEFLRPNMAELIWEQ
ncbi:MAG: DUF3298 domain-containing protein [Legionella sp.]|nr:DUF3298 domain-containing protein [Legionella sp.]